MASLFIILLLLLAGCSGPTENFQKAEDAAHQIINDKQQALFNKVEPFDISPAAVSLRRRLLEGQNLPFSNPASLGSNNLESIPFWPDIHYPEKVIPALILSEPWYDENTLIININDSLQIGARNSRNYQDLKEDIFIAALALDLERDEFRNSYTGLLETMFSTVKNNELTLTGIENNFSVSLARRFKSGLSLTAKLGIDLVKLLTLDRASSFGVFADASISIPLLRGSGRHIVTEPLTQAERNVVYAMYRFERFKRQFAVQIADEYLSVLQRHRQIKNIQENYNNLSNSAFRANRLAQAGRLPEEQVNQTMQDVLRAKDRLILAQNNYENGLDLFKMNLGLPADANIMLNHDDIDQLVYQINQATRGNSKSENNLQIKSIENVITNALAELTPEQTYFLSEKKSIQLALDNRVDLRIVAGDVYDKQRAVIIAADNLRSELNLFANANTGEGRTLSNVYLPDGRLNLKDASYSALLTLDLPWERTREMIDFRNSLISLERSVRAVQSLEDQIKLEVRGHIRDLEEFRQRIGIQAKAVEVAEKRVASTTLFMSAGRLQIRDLLEAEEALLSSRNDLITAQVNYRVASLELQRDMGILEVDTKGLFKEFELDKDE